ncbi:transmembrane protein 254 [Lates japonicus]|uniref:Transmembrane protein 254 n=1 Tax=Lates japonicus TaxID=270547 RepID=A0AAD3MM45_LATJO|nr:transmembrane protein 254 [Lates japonicus]
MYVLFKPCPLALYLMRTLQSCGSGTDFPEADAGHGLSQELVFAPLRGSECLLLIRVPAIDQLRAQKASGMERPGGGGSNSCCIVLIIKVEGQGKYDKPKEPPIPLHQRLHALWWAAWAIHVFEAFISLKVCSNKGVDNTATRCLWFFQTFLFGFASLGLLLKYNPERPKHH